MNDFRNVKFEDLSKTGKWLLEDYGRSDWSQVLEEVGNVDLQASDGNLKISIKRMDRWEGKNRNFSRYQIVLKNIGKIPISSWDGMLGFSENIILEDQWSDEFYVEMSQITISPLSWNRGLEENEEIKMGFIVSGEEIPRLTKAKINSQKMT